MSVVAVALVLGLLVVMLLRTSALGGGSALLCILFGVVHRADPRWPDRPEHAGHLGGVAVGPGAVAMSGLGKTRAMGGTRRNESPVRLNVARVHVPLSAILAAWVARQVGRFLGWTADSQRGCGDRPSLAADRPGGAAGGGPCQRRLRACRAAGARACSQLWASGCGGGGGPSRSPAAWRGESRGAWRARMVYGFAWQPAMATTGLAVTLDGTEYLPKLLRVSSTGSVDRVTVRMLPGQVFEDWASVGERLAQTFGAQDCRVRTTKTRHRLELWFLTDDPLTSPVTPFGSLARKTSASAPIRPRSSRWTWWIWTGPGRVV